MKAAKHGFRLTLGILMIAMLVMGSLGFSAYAQEALPSDVGQATGEMEEYISVEDATIAAQSLEPMMAGNFDLSTWSGLQEQINLGGTVTLTADVTAGKDDKPLEIPVGMRVTLNLNGHTIDRGQNLEWFYGISLEAIHVYGTLTLMDSAGGGKIIGGHALNGSASSYGVGVVNEGGFTMLSGTIEASRSSVHNKNGTFSLSGGTVGSITNEGTFNLSGAPKISGTVSLMNNNPINITGTLGVDVHITVGIHQQTLPFAVTEGLADNGGLENFEAYNVLGESSLKYGLDLDPDGEVYIDNLYTVTFDSDGGSKVESQEVLNNHKATKPADPTLTGSVFDEWRTENVNGNVYDFENPVTNNLTLYASWLTPWKALQKDLKAGGTVTLTENVTAGSDEDPLVIPEGVEVTLDLNGCTLDCGTDNQKMKDGAIKVEGALTLKDSSATGDSAGTGKITGSTTNNIQHKLYGGVSVDKSGTFTMLSGSISNSPAGYLSVSNDGTFIFTGGTVNAIGNSGEFHLSNATTITGQVSLANNAVINITDKLASETRIRVDLLAFRNTL